MSGAIFESVCNLELAPTLQSIALCISTSCSSRTIHALTVLRTIGSGLFSRTKNYYFSSVYSPTSKPTTSSLRTSLRAARSCASNVRFPNNVRNPFVAGPVGLVLGDSRRHRPGWFSKSAQRSSPGTIGNSGSLGIRTSTLAFFGITATATSTAASCPITR